MIKFVLLLTLMINSAFCQNIVELSKGDLAPFSGALVNPSQMKEFRLINEQKKSLETQKITLEDLNEVNQNRINFYKEETENYRNLVKKERSKRAWSNTGFFVLGVLATSLAAYAAIQATK